MRTRTILVFFSFPLLACSSSSSHPAQSTSDASNAEIVCNFDSKSGCATITACTIPDSSRVHVAQGTGIDYPTNPPCGGHHYPVWVEWGVHSSPIPVGNWVHNLEHGGVVLLYRCASRDACPDVAAKLEAIANGVPPDPECVAEGRTLHARVLVLPDPDLPVGVQVGAAAWGYSLAATCVDEAMLRKFYDDHIGKGPEQLCAQGAIDPSTDAGPTMDAMADSPSDGG